MAQIAKGVELQAGDGGTPELFTTIAQVTSVTGLSLSNAVIDVTDLSSNAKAFLQDIEDSGEITLELNFDADGAGHKALITRIQAESLVNYQICWPDRLGADFQAYVAADVTIAADTVDEVGHGYTTGQPCEVATVSTLPDPLVVGVIYYLIWDSANTYQYALTNANAVAGTQIDLTDQGGAGNHTTYTGQRYDFAAYVTGVTPAGSTGDALKASVTFKVTGAVDLN